MKETMIHQQSSFESGEGASSPSVKNSAKRKVVFGVCIAVLIAILCVFAVLGILYGARPTISISDADGSSSGSVFTLPRDIEDSVGEYNVDADTLESSEEVPAGESVMLVGEHENRMIFLRAKNTADKAQPITDCGKITELSINEQSGDNIALGSVGRPFNIKGLYFRGVRIGMSEEQLLQNNGTPDAEIEGENGAKIHIYKINIYHQIRVECKENAVISVSFIKARNLFSKVADFSR